MNGARDLARWHVRAAFWLERPGVAVVLSGEVEERAVLRQAVIAWLGEVAVIFLQLFAARSNIEVAFEIVGEVAAPKRSVRSLGLVHQFHRTKRSRVRKIMDRACCSSVFNATKRIVGLDAASASAASFFWRRTNGLT
jgi:hypothetical protein